MAVGKKLFPVRYARVVEGMDDVRDAGAALSVDATGL